MKEVLDKKYQFIKTEIFQKNCALINSKVNTAIFRKLAEREGQNHKIVLDHSCISELGIY